LVQRSPRKSDRFARPFLNAEFVAPVGMFTERDQQVL
jgi:hypothetical protein